MSLITVNQTCLDVSAHTPRESRSVPARTRRCGDFPHENHHSANVFLKCARLARIRHFRLSVYCCQRTRRYDLPATRTLCGPMSAPDCPLLKTSANQFCSVSTEYNYLSFGEMTLSSCAERFRLSIVLVKSSEWTRSLVKPGLAVEREIVQVLVVLRRSFWRCGSRRTASGWRVSKPASCDCGSPPVTRFALPNVFQNLHHAFALGGSGTGARVDGIGTALVPSTNPYTASPKLIVGSSTERV